MTKLKMLSLVASTYVETCAGWPNELLSFLQGHTRREFFFFFFFFWSRLRILYFIPCYFALTTNGSHLWLAKWCKIHKVYIHSYSMLLLIFTNIFSHIQQPNLHSKNIFIHIYLYISYSRLYLLTFTRCFHSHSTSYIHSHSRSKYSVNIFCASPLRIGQKR